MKYNFDVIQIEGGQRARYGDSYYHYEIVDNSPIKHSEHVIKEFCTRFVLSAKTEDKYKADIKDGDFGQNFATYWTDFKKMDNGHYLYLAVMPSTH